MRVPGSTIQLEALSAQRGGRTVLKHITCSFPAGQTTAILGRSGSGKSTLLRLVNGLLDPAAGRILHNARDVREWNQLDLRRSIGFVPQSLGLFPHWTVRRQIARFHRHPLPVPELAMSLGLGAELLDRYPDELSGGEQQRVALARAIAGDPPVLMMDEPFSALDPLVRRDMQDLIRRLGKTILFVTHDLREALRLSTRLLFLREGQVVFEGNPADFAACPDSEVQLYLRSLES